MKVKSSYLLGRRILRLTTSCLPPKVLNSGTNTGTTYDIHISHMGLGECSIARLSSTFPIYPKNRQPWYLYRYCVWKHQYIVRPQAFSPCHLYRRLRCESLSSHRDRWLPRVYCRKASCTTSRHFLYAIPVVLGNTACATYTTFFAPPCKCKCPF